MGRHDVVIGELKRANLLKQVAILKKHLYFDEKNFNYFFSFHPIVVLDNAGFSKGYGFIRFGDEKEQQTALASMMGASGLGMKPIRVSVQTFISKLNCNQNKFKVTRNFIVF